MENEIKNTKEGNGVGSGIGVGVGNGSQPSPRNEEANKNSGSDKLQRITVSRDAQSALGAITDRVNDGFLGGKVNLTQMANWVLLRFSSELDEAQIKEIRAEYFDEVAMLESVLKQAKESGKVPTDFKVLLQKQIGLDEPNKRKNKAA